MILAVMGIPLPVPELLKNSLKLNSLPVPVYITFPKDATTFRKVPSTVTFSLYASGLLTRKLDVLSALAKLKSLMRAAASAELLKFWIGM